jgi:hypothetical protein
MSTSTCTLFQGRKTFQRVDGAGHNNLFDFALVDVLEKYLTGLAEH